MPPARPDVIGKYTVERFIESGGMGDVYLARDPTLDRPVAIKLLREGFDSQEMRERFEREARAAGRLSHPNIVTIYEFGEFAGRPFIAMEFVRGEPLSKLIRRREPLGVARKLEMMEGLCAGLGHAHKAGIVHRDIKPANLMVDLEGGPLKILDFGIVRMAGSGLTSHGVLVGTVNYMSPEQISGRGTIDHRSDVFAVGAVLHELFTYQRAFPGEMTDVLYKIVHAQPASAAALDPTLDPGIVRAIDICLQKAPEHRYQDLAMLRRDLARIRQRLELEEQQTHGHGYSVATVRALRDVPSHPSHPGAAPTGTPPPTPWVTPPPAPPATTPKPAPAAPQTSPSERARREAAAEQARLQRQAEEARLEQVRQEHLRQEQVRIERERAEAAQREREKIAREREAAERERAAQAERARAEEAERARIAAAQAEQARIAAAQAEQARLERERRAREQAERDRLAAEQRAREDAERREREAVAAQVAAAAEALAREDFSGASRLVQAVLAAHPGHGGARALERDLVRGVELRGRAATAVERARGLFERSPGDALDALEQFSPPHRLVDAALAELRGRHADNERARLLRERRERLKANIDWTVGRAGTLARNRIVQGSAAVLVIVVALGLWLASRPEAPAPETGSAAPVRSAPATPAAIPTPTGPEPAAQARREPAGPGVAGGARPSVDRDVPASPDDGIDRRGQVRVRDLEPRTEQPRLGAPAGDTTRPSAPPPPAVTERAGAAPTVGAPSPAIEERPATASNASARPQPPDDPGARGTTPVTTPAPVPAAPSPVEIAQEEIRQWMAEYQAAFRALDERRVKAMNRQSDLRASQLRTASVEFQSPVIVVEPDGRTATLRASARYEYSWRRAGGSPVSELRINWRMTKVGNAWVANN